MELMTIAQAGAYLNVSRSTVYRLMHSGALAYTVVSGRRRIPLVSLERLIAKGMQEAGRTA